MQEGALSYAHHIALEAEQQQLLRKLQRTQRHNTELAGELDAAKKRLQRLRYERNLLLDKVYEREVASLEFSSSSTSEDEDENSNSNDPGRVFSAHARLPRQEPATPLSLLSSVAAAAKREPAQLPDELDVLSDHGSAAKRKRMVKTAEMAAATPRKAMAVPTDEHGNAVLPITIGVVTLHSLGQIVADRPSFHNKRYIWPAGFHSSRPYLSALDATAQTVYHSRILDSGAGPLFDVYALDNPDQHYQSQTPTGAWTFIVKQVNAIRGREYSNSASGPDFFGLSNPTISMLIEKLSDSEKCTQYQRKVYETATAAGNVSASTKPALNRGVSRRNSSTSMNAGTPADSDLGDDFLNDHAPGRERSLDLEHEPEPELELELEVDTF